MVSDKEDFERIIASATSIKIERLLNDNLFFVPPNQRPYSWNKDNWIELWDDLWGVIKEREKKEPNIYYKYHFFGPMFFITKEEGERVLRVLDGQQRIATIGILLTVIFDFLDLMRNKGLISTAGAIVLGKINASLFEKKQGKSFIKISLGKDNKDFYEEIITPKLIEAGDKFIDPISKIYSLKNETDYIESNELILDCYKFFVRGILCYLAKQQNIELGKKIQSDTVYLIISKKNEEVERILLNLYEAASDGLYVLINKVPSCDIVYEMFETLNQRGLKLFVIDLFKNLIFEHFEKGLGTQKIESLWEELSNIALEDLDEFLRHFWLSKIEFIRGKHLFRALRSKIENQSSEDFKIFFSEMIKEARIYSALTNSSDSLWENHQDISQIIEELDYLGFKQGLPLILSAYVTFFNNNKESFTTIIKSYLNLCVRSYTILRNNPNEFEEDYSKLAIEVRNGTINAEKLISTIKNKTPRDNDIEDAFIGLNGVKPRIGKYILCKINDSLVKTPLNCVWRNNPTLEHVIPKKPEKWWGDYLKEKNMRHKDFLERLGNLTILSSSENAELGNISYPEKRKKYLEMDLPINEVTFREFNEFDSKAIETRERIMYEIIIKNKIW